VRREGGVPKAFTAVLQIEWSPRPDSNRGPFPYQVVLIPGEFELILSATANFGRDHLPRPVA
jgi:hypothetical protein